MALTATYNSGGMHKSPYQVSTSYYGNQGYTKTSSQASMRQGNAKGIGYIKIIKTDLKNQKCTIRAFTGILGRGSNADSICTYSNPAYSSVSYTLNGTKYTQYTNTRMSKDGSSDMSTSNWVYWGSGEFQAFTKGIEFTVPLGSTKKDIKFTFNQVVGLPDNPSSSYHIYNWANTISTTLTIPAGYKAPSDLTLTTSTTSTSVKVTASWTKGVNTTSEKVNITVNGKTKTIKTNGSYVTFTYDNDGIYGNTKYSVSGALYDGSSKKDTASTTATTLPRKPHKIEVSKVGPATFTLRGRSYNGTGNSFKYQYRYKKSTATSYTEWKATSSYDTPYTVTGLTPNTKYNIQVRADNSIANPSAEYGTTTWTVPEIAELTLSLPAGSEHNSIHAKATAKGGTANAKYLFSIDSTSLNKSYNTNPYTFTGLKGNSTHTIRVALENTVSGLRSDIVKKTITTWYDPLRDLSVILSDKWFWLLKIKAGYLYDGTIKSYTFRIYNGTHDYSSGKITTNEYTAGTAIGGNSKNLSYNTDYNCSVEIIDNHGRTYTANKVFRTLDERPLYLNGKLAEVKVIKPDNSIEYITPNLLTVNQDNDIIVNMNKVINNDNRTEFE